MHCAAAQVCMQRRVVFRCRWLQSSTIFHEIISLRTYRTHPINSMSLCIRLRSKYWTVSFGCASVRGTGYIGTEHTTGAKHLRVIRGKSLTRARCDANVLRFRWIHPDYFALHVNISLADWNFGKIIKLWTCGITRCSTDEAQHEGKKCSFGGAWDVLSLGQAMMLTPNQMRKYFTHRISW